MSTHGGENKREDGTRQVVGYLWAVTGVAAATLLFWLVRSYLDKGQASLLYLPIVIACATRFGFGPAVLGAGLSFLCWNFFFLPPFYTFIITDPKDWISLFVFLVAAVTTAQLASQARTQTQQAGAREAEIATLFQASEAISREIHADKLLSALTLQLQTLSHASRCLVFRRASPRGLRLVSAQPSGQTLTRHEEETLRGMAEAAFEHHQIIGFGRNRALWTKALDAIRTDRETVADAEPGVYVPLQVEKHPVGVLHVGPRLDNVPFSAMDERLILTLANHAAVVIAREDLAEQAAQAEALREADVLKDSLLSLVSHELRTPLAAIKATVTGMLAPSATWDEASRAENLHAVDRETDRLSAVVGNLLDLSRLDAGAWRPQKDWCDLGEIVGTVLDRMAETQATRVHVRFADDLPLVRADYTQIALVLINLLENAVKYTPPGSQIDLSATDDRTGPEAAPSGIMLTVRDFGPGLTPGEEEHLFERFYRGQAHRNSAVHGTGLGLALCLAVIRAHNGRLWATNAPAGEPSGAVFHIFLPVGAEHGGHT